MDQISRGRGALFTVLIYSQLEVGKKNPDEGSIVSGTVKVWKWEEQVKKNDKKKGNLNFPLFLVKLRKVPVNKISNLA